MLEVSQTPLTMARMAKEATVKSPMQLQLTLKLVSAHKVLPTSLIQSVFDVVYDIDGEIGPFSNLEEVKGIQIFDEEGVAEKSPDAQENPQKLKVHQDKILS